MRIVISGDSGNGASLLTPLNTTPECPYALLMQFDMIHPSIIIDSVWYDPSKYHWPSLIWYAQVASLIQCTIEMNQNTTDLSIMRYWYIISTYHSIRFEDDRRSIARVVAHYRMAPTSRDWLSRVAWLEWPRRYRLVHRQRGMCHWTWCIYLQQGQWATMNQWLRWMRLS